MFSKKNILVISPDAWGENFVSKHHYAVSLAKSEHQVFFLNPPTTKNFNIKTSAYENLLIIDYKPRFRGIRMLPPFLSAWLTLLELERLEKKAHTKFDIIWNFETSRFFNLAMVPAKVIKISHIVDYTENFNLALASKTADLCLGTSDYINKEQRKFNKKVYKVHHGVSPCHNDEDWEIHLEGKFPIRVGYVGNLSIRYIDWKTIFAVCKKIL